MRAIRAIIPAAGKGKRLQKVSGDIPKAMVKVCEKPMLEIVLENISFVDNSDIYIVVGCGKEAILERFGSAYNYVEQKEQLGTGHAVMMCEEHFKDFDGNVLVTFGDMPLFRRDEFLKMCRIHEESDADCTLMTAENPLLTMWARVVRDESDRFAAIVEGKDCTEEEAKIKELFSGVMIFKSSSLFEILPKVGCKNVQKEYYLTEVPELMVREGMKVETYLTPNGEDLHGINTPEDLVICESILEKRLLTV